jgi:hypothetical protein
VDIDGDGRKDLVVWQVLGNLDFKTDVYVFLSGADGKLPERPTQVLHCRGIPIPIGSTQQASPIGDLKGDGTHQLVLVEPKIAVFSVDSLVEMVLSQGADLALTVRSFNHGAFSRSPDAVIATKGILSLEQLGGWPIFICGDFNGDGRPDLVVRRSTSQWNIFSSTKDGRWFAPQPAMTFETPMEGYVEVQDLNGDGRADVILWAWNDPRVFILLAPSPRRKGNP